ncbi:MAG: hypothetical protein E6J56_12250 [Deltaproteobacteria bacterium]|nr:MAG: hypothetical protein E6J56_12250 [Deltaproteobacteria bacterium]
MVLVLEVVVTTGPPQPIGSFVSSMPSGRTPKSGSGQSRSSAPRSGRAPVKRSLTLAMMTPRSTAVEALASVASCGTIVVR